MRRHLALSLALLVTTGVATGQILDANGAPSTGFAAFHAWFDASNGPNGGTVAPGAPVTTWTDASGNGRDLVRVNADVARQPVYDASSAMGLPSVEFDGDDYIWGDNATEFGTLAGPKTFFVAARTDASDRGYIFDSSSVAGRNALFAGQNSAPNVWHVYSGNGAATPGPAVTLGVWEVHTCVFDANAQEHLINGVTVSTGAEVTADLSGLVIGNRYNVVLGHVGGIAELLVYEGVLSASDRQAIEGYLAGKYSIGTIGSSYCMANANSTGVSASISATGQTLAASNDVALACDFLPSNSFGFFITSRMQGFVPNPAGSQGNLCLSGAIGRYVGAGQIQNAGNQGAVTLALDLLQTPTPTGLVAVQAGETWNFTYWYRDANPSVTSNFANGLELQFQ